MRRRAYTILRIMAGVQAVGEEFGEDLDVEIVRDGRTYWFGCERLKSATFHELIRCASISSTGESGMEHFGINDTGRAIVRRRELADEVAIAMSVGRPFTIRNDQVVPL